MKAALAVNLVGADVAANVDQMLALASAAADAGAALVVFPETAATGLVNTDDPARDLPLGEPIPGAVTGRCAALARRRSIWLALGLFERAGGRLYDSAVLMSPGGELALHYRRITPGWHGPAVDPAAYGAGTELGQAETPFGRVMFLICGDLFSDTLVSRVREQRPDLVLFPFARCFDGPGDQQRWDAEEMPAYAARVRMIGSSTLMVNYLSAPGDPDEYFGGAWVVRPDGAVSHHLPLGRPGLLIAEL